MLATPHRPWRAYAASKLANLLYAFELSRLLARMGSQVVVATAHPGYAATDLQRRGPALAGGRSVQLRARALGAITDVVAQSASQGALPQLRAATDASVRSGSSWGPSGGMRGAAVEVVPPARARNEDIAAALFDRTEELTGLVHRFG
jgi:NAD(P)-dependent dehydrogenase (short-subunit alcohol dehydrogenase family)